MYYVTGSALDAALDHLIHRGDTDIVPVPFEYKAIRQEWTRLRGYLLKRDLDKWTTRSLRRCLAPKQQLGLRIATQLDPLDTILVTALIHEAGPTIEAARISPELEVVHSYRYDPGTRGQLYDPAWNFESFRKRSISLAQEVGCRFVVLTDIADFFPRIYTHLLENTLTSAIGDGDLARVLYKLFHGWNLGVSYGVPVGPAAVRILSDLVINDVDQSMRSESIQFCRYSDDFRIFTSTERQARQALSFLATVLFKNHGLTVQESKTNILSADEFLRRYSPTDMDEERAHLSQWFEHLVQQLDVDTYEDIDLEELTDEQQRELDELNLWDIVKDAVSGRIPVTSRLAGFALRRIRQLGLVDQEELILQNMRSLAPLFRDAIEAATAAVDQDDIGIKRRIGDRLLELMHHDVVGHLDYHRAWLLQPFIDDTAVNSGDKFLTFYNRYSDSFTRTAAILSMGRYRQDYWFRNHKRDLTQFGPWERRAFLYGASCLPKDEADYWYRSMRPYLDELELAVVNYARSNPFRARP